MPDWGTTTARVLCRLRIVTLAALEKATEQQIAAINRVWEFVEVEINEYNKDMSGQWRSVKGKDRRNRVREQLRTRFSEEAFWDGKRLGENSPEPTSWRGVTASQSRRRRGEPRPMRTRPRRPRASRATSGTGRCPEAGRRNPGAKLLMVLRWRIAWPSKRRIGRGDRRPAAPTPARGRARPASRRRRGRRRRAAALFERRVLTDSKLI